MASTHPEAPYISVVAAARNGVHNDNIQAFVDSWTREAARVGLCAELFVVNPATRNSAIRRARGEFILSTSTDIAFSAELMRFLASRQLQKGKLYRIDCHEADRVHAREGTFRLTSDGLRENEADDIAAAASGIHFGEGWFPPERDPASDAVYRWIENGAQVNLRAGGTLALELEPGPGVGPLPQILQVLDATGAKVAEWSIGGRAVVQLWVPPAAQESLRTFRLFVPDGGRALTDDLRILNFRFFRCDWVQPRRADASPRGLLSMRPTLTRFAVANLTGGMRGAIRLLKALTGDIFGAGIEYWGSGWHRLEEAGTERFRWVSTDAELVVKLEGAQQDLCLLVEPGPSLNGRPFQLLIRLAGGQEIAEVPVRGLTLVRVPLPRAAGTVTALFLSPDARGEALPGDSRVLNFRVLACACEPSRHPLATADLVAAAGWTAVKVSEQPAGIDWAARLNDRGRELAEIGTPAFLHVNACDFILMERDRWLDLRGYPESAEPPEYLDALLCYAAHFAGAAEEVLREPLRIARTAGTRDERTALDPDMVWLITQMRRLRTPAILNAAAWGERA